tara:strand:+ start:1088 stop:2611 length:1524 start_codon:yes stop_codon:yes gene_type:complete
MTLDQELDNLNIMMLLEMATQAFGDRVAFRCDGESLSYDELFAAAGQAAVAIRESGCQHVSMLDESSLATPVALFASAWAGVPYVPINYRLTDDEISALVGRIDPVYLIGGKDSIAKVSCKGVVIESSRFLANARSSSAPTEPWSMVPEDIAILLFTSGTTGEPKAAVLRQSHLVSYILGSSDFMSALETDVALVCVPPYHIAGIASLISAVYSGRRVVQLPGFTAESWLDNCAKEQVTSAFVVPTMLTRIVDNLEGTDKAELPSLNAISYGGGKMPLAVIERALALFPQTNFTNAYGLTETSSTVTLLTPDAHREALASADEKVRRRLTSVGVSLPGIEIEIRDEDGTALGPDQSGEVYIRGEQVSGEYVGKGSVLDKDGWFPTRDAGSLDTGGYLFLEGRADDVIVRGGENMSPGEIEDVLLQHEAVSDVAVIGIPDEQWGEAVAAVVVLKTGQRVKTSELQIWVKDRMRSSRVPQAMEFWPELPYSETGKLLRRVVKAELAEAN